MSSLRTFQIDYDDDFDILYVKMKGSDIEHSEEINGGIFASFSAEEEIVGFIIMDLSERTTLPLGVYSRTFAGIELGFVRTLLPHGEQFELYGVYEVEYQTKIQCGALWEEMIDETDFMIEIESKKEEALPSWDLATSIFEYEGFPSGTARPKLELSSCSLIEESDICDREEDLAA